MNTHCRFTFVNDLLNWFTRGGSEQWGNVIKLFSLVLMRQIIRYLFPGRLSHPSLIYAVSAACEGEYQRALHFSLCCKGLLGDTLKLICPGCQWGSKERFITLTPEGRNQIYGQFQISQRKLVTNEKLERVWWTSVKISLPINKERLGCL
jgi:hypothetical protein